MGKDVGGGEYDNVRVSLRRDTQAQWLFKNPIPAAGEPCLEVNTNQLKFGDGITRYNSLPYFGGSGGSGSVTSVNASIGGALTVTGGPITSTGTLAFTWTGANTQQVLGDGSLVTRITNNNQLTNGANYITASALTGYVPYTGATASVLLGSNDLIARYLYSSDGGVTGGIFSLPGVNPIMLIGTTSNHGVGFFSNNSAAALYVHNINGYITVNPVFPTANVAQFSVIGGGLTTTLAIRNNTDTTTVFSIGISGAVGVFNRMTFSNGSNVATGTTTGTVIAETSAQKLAFWAQTPIIQPTNTFTAANGAYASVGGTTISSNDTFGGYSIPQLVSILKAIGFVA